MKNILLLILSGMVLVIIGVFVFLQSRTHNLLSVSSITLGLILEATALIHGMRLLKYR